MKEVLAEQPVAVGVEEQVVDMQVVEERERIIETVTDLESPKIVREDEQEEIKAADNMEIVDQDPKV